MQEAAAAGTWAQGGAGCFLDILPLTEGAPVERRRVGAAPAPFLPAAPTAGAADGPLGPRRPPTVHWPDREGLGSGSGGFLRHAGPGARAGGLAGKPWRGGYTVPTAPPSTSRRCGHQGSQSSRAAPRPLQLRPQPSAFRGGNACIPSLCLLLGAPRTLPPAPGRLPTLPLNPHLTGLPTHRPATGRCDHRCPAHPHLRPDTPSGSPMGTGRPRGHPPPGPGPGPGPTVDDDGG